MRITEYLVAIIGKFSNKKQLVLQVELSIDKLKQNVDNFMIFHNSQIYNLYNVYEADTTDII